MNQPTLRSTRLSTFLLTAALALFTLSPRAAAQPKPDSKPPEAAPAAAPSQEELDKAFAERMTNAVMAGQWSDGVHAPKGDKYTIVSVQKLPGKGDTWVFNARIQFGGKDVTIPLLIPVKWAGDTAVISVTDFNVPGLGTYTSRVVVYKDQYAGTWSGKDHGGYLWGHIEKAPPEKAPAEKPATDIPADQPKAPAK